jgi:hypothetical protein
MPLTLASRGVVDTARYDSSTGTLTFTALQPLSSGVTISFKVGFTNPVRLQQGEKMTISGTAGVEMGTRYGSLDVVYAAQHLAEAVLDTVWKGSGTPPTQMRIDPSKDAEVTLPGGGGVSIPAGAFPPGVEPVVTIQPNNALREGKYNTCPGRAVFVPECPAFPVAEPLTFLPSPVTFLKPVTLSIKLEDTLQQNAYITAARLDEVSGEWKELQGTVVNPDTQLASVAVTSFSSYSALKIPQPIERFPAHGQDRSSRERLLLFICIPVSSVLLVCCLVTVHLCMQARPFNLEKHVATLSPGELRKLQQLDEEGDDGFSLGLNTKSRSLLQSKNFDALPAPAEQEYWGDRETKRRARVSVTQESDAPLQGSMPSNRLPSAAGGTRQAYPPSSELLRARGAAGAIRQMYDDAQPRNVTTQDADPLSHLQPACYTPISAYSSSRYTPEAQISAGPAARIFRIDPNFVSSASSREDTQYAGVLGPAAQLRADVTFATPRKQEAAGHGRLSADPSFAV